VAEARSSELMSSRLHNWVVTAAAMLVALACCGRILAASQAVVSLSSAPTVIEADGKSTTIITATVRGGDGGLVSDNSPVRFSTTLGTLSTDTVNTISGVARVVLTSSSTAGTATVTATYFGGSSAGVGTNNIDVQFTSDKDLVSSDGDARWLRVDCPAYLVYSADAKVIQADANGKNGAAHLHYGSLYIEADTLQVDVQSMQVIAKNAIVHRGKHSLEVAEIQYDLVTSTGTAVLPATATTQPRSVTVTGSAFDTMDLTPEAADDAVQHNLYEEMDLSNSRVIVSARAISVDPGTQIQFTKAAIYSDGKKVLAMPFHVMPLTTDQLFGEQVVGFSSQGLFLNIPFYYHVSPESTGTIYLRNSAVASSGIVTGLAPSFGSTGTRPGLAIDLQHTYEMAGGNGAFALNSLTRSDWGASWNHSQRFDASSNGYFYLDFPEHRGLFATSSVHRDFKTFSATVNVNASQDPGELGFSESSKLLNAFLQTNAKPIGHSHINYSNDLSVESGHVIASAPGSPSLTTNLSTQAVNLGLASDPIRPDKLTTVSDSLTFGEAYDYQSRLSSPSFLGSVGASRTFPKNGRLILNYTYRYDPLQAYYSQQAATNNLLAFLNPAIQQTLSLTGSVAPTKLSFFTMSGYFSPSFRRTSFFTNYTYNVNTDWGFGVSSFLENDLWGHYNSLQFSLTRKILGRYLIFSYGTDTHRLRFDLGAGQF
jgi:hypothetical protein